MRRVGTLGGRTLLLVALAMAVTLGVTFIVVDLALRGLARARIEDSIERGERGMDAADASFKQQQIDWLEGITQSAALRTPLSTRPESRGATEAALLEIGRATRMSLLATVDHTGQAVAAIADGQTTTLPLSSLPPPGIFRILRAGGRLYEATEIPLVRSNGAAGLLLGREVHLDKIPHSGYLTLMEGARVVDSEIPRGLRSQLEESLRHIDMTQPGDGRDAGWEISIAGQGYLATPIRGATFRPPYCLLSVQSTDARVAEVTDGLGHLFVDTGAFGMVLVVAFAVFVSRSTSRPLNRLVAIVRENGGKGKLAPNFPTDFPVFELNLLAAALNGAAQSASESRHALDGAYQQFIETMAQALDARDPYTAGHSLRVAAFSHAIAKEMGVIDPELETIRLAAQLHDIGKIGIPDAVLQKPGRLTPEEYGLIKLHPQIGRKILEKVGQFQKLLDVVELHHENPDGSGYPYGLKTDRTPLDARIVHVADAFDAMTTTRSYRSALSIVDAVNELTRNAGRQFDAAIVETFVQLIHSGKYDHLLVEAGHGLIDRTVKPARRELFVATRR